MFCKDKNDWVFARSHGRRYYWHGTSVLDAELVKIPGGKVDRVGWADLVSDRWFRPWIGEFNFDLVGLSFHVERLDDDDAYSFYCWISHSRSRENINHRERKRDQLKRTY